LAGALARGLRSAYLVTGAEPLLIGEACDLIRGAARNAGYAERELHFLDRGFDWNRLMTGRRTCRSSASGASSSCVSPDRSIRRPPAR